MMPSHVQQITKMMEQELFVFKFLIHALKDIRMMVKEFVSLTQELVQLITEMMEQVLFV